MFFKTILTIFLLLWGVASADVLGGRKGCFLLIDLKDNRVVEQAGLNQRLPPCSTFKVAAAVMSFDAKVLTMDRVFRWNGVKDSRPEVNQDQTAASWMERSVVWVTQVLTQELGMKRVKAYLAKFAYGNQDFSGGLTRAWLTSSLLIDSREQARFMSDLWREKLPVSQQAQKLTKQILVVQTSGQSRLSGKTGSGTWESTDLGRYVGILQCPQGEYVVVLDFQGKCQGPGGWTARQMVIDHLREKGLW
ncbi:MAG: class D beta-lactamase [Candidatus Eremiobacteraeota bacterium]|nr:class D beta-lactamase [Candidatus Eremiobacteraeota bacterium]MCW5872536.1 class D beta-lactamase [Candidatus Eremiobacteraeota bacterium]